MIESEIKIKVEYPDLTTLEKEFRQNFEYVSEETHEDIYYNSIYRDFRITDEALRLRITKDTVELTYKGPKISTASKTREEITCKLLDGKAMSEILERLGFYKVITIKKIRKNFKYKQFIISLDHVEGLGDFLEIEGLNVKEEELISFAEDLLKRFRIKGEKTLKSYLELLIEKR